MLAIFTITIQARSHKNHFKSTNKLKSLGGDCQTGFLKIYSFLIEGKFLYNIALASAMHLHELAIHIHMPLPLELHPHFPPFSTHVGCYRAPV